MVPEYLGLWMTQLVGEEKRTTEEAQGFSSSALTSCLREAPCTVLIMSRIDSSLSIFAGLNQCCVNI